MDYRTVRVHGMLLNPSLRSRCDFAEVSCRQEFDVERNSWFVVDEL